MAIHLNVINQNCSYTFYWIEWFNYLGVTISLLGFNSLNWILCYSGTPRMVCSMIIKMWYQQVLLLFFYHHMRELIFIIVFWGDILKSIVFKILIYGNLDVYGAAWFGNLCQTCALATFLMVGSWNFPEQFYHVLRLIIPAGTLVLTSSWLSSVGILYAHKWNRTHTQCALEIWLQLNPSILTFSNWWNLWSFLLVIRCTVLIGLARSRLW